MPFLKIPTNLKNSVAAHKKWLEILKEAQALIDDDTELQVRYKKYYVGKCNPLTILDNSQYLKGLVKNSVKMRKGKNGR